MQPLVNEYLRITPQISLLDSVQYNAGSVVSRFLSDWKDEPDFKAAYACMWDDMERTGRGHRSQSEEKKYAYLTGPWKMHHVCWAAFQARRLPGDFVDIGTGLGAVIRCALNYLKENNLDHPITWCVDRWDERDLSYQQSDEEKALGLRPSVYVRNLSEIEEMFSNYQSCRLIQGTIPDCLGAVESEHVSFVYSDLNIAAPEIAAAEYLWPKMLSGGIYMIDDYGMFPKTREAFDTFARSRGVKIASLASGPGLMIKP